MTEVTLKVDLVDCGKPKRDGYYYRFVSLGRNLFEAGPYKTETGARREAKKEAAARNWRISE